MAYIDIKIDTLEKASQSFVNTSQNAISNLKRFINNTFLNVSRQQALNAILGMFDIFFNIIFI
jgi:hypothetical protein